jgi:hypothetical protein
VTVVLVPKPLPVVAPAPDSPVSHLIPVDQPVPAPYPTSTATPGPSTSPGPNPAPTAPVVYSSTNWAGYMSPAGNFTGIGGSWTVPHVTGNGFTSSGDAAWIGIGGVTGNDLIQVGTDDTVSPSGHVSTIAFYEMLPAPETPVPGMNVAAGDVMSADIHLLSGTQWQINISDVTQNETFSITVSYASTKSSAEWIQEDPSYSNGSLVPFDTFGTVSFTGAQATAGSTTETMAASGAQEIIMVNNHGHAIATPTAIGSDGQSFSVNGG